MVILSAVIRVIIWIVSPTAMAKNAMRRRSISVDSARPILAGISRYMKSTWMCLVRRVADEMPMNTVQIRR